MSVIPDIPGSLWFFVLGQSLLLSTRPAGHCNAPFPIRSRVTLCAEEKPTDHVDDSLHAEPWAFLFQVMCQGLRGMLLVPAAWVENESGVLLYCINVPKDILPQNWGGEGCWDVPHEGL